MSRRQTRRGRGSPAHGRGAGRGEELEVATRDAHGEEIGVWVREEGASGYDLLAARGRQG